MAGRLISYEIETSSASALVSCVGEWTKGVRNLSAVDQADVVLSKVEMLDTITS